MQRQRSAFTLIELLVVIAIIAILAAILFPVFAQARAQARKTTCLSNVKQITLGAHMYTQDYDEKLVPSRLEYGTGGIEQHWPGLIQPYIKNFDIMRCPDRESDWGGGFADRVQYGMNHDQIGWGDSISLAAVNRPTGIIYFADTASLSANPDAPWGSDNTEVYNEFVRNPDRGRYPNPPVVLQLANGVAFRSPAQYNFNAQVWCSVEVPIARHNGMCNVSFIDGHAKAIRVSSVWIRPGEDFNTYWNGERQAFNPAR